MKRILFFTYSEHGQAQIHLSIAYELLSRSDVEIHIASFEELAPRTVEISDLFNQQNKQNVDIKFHLIDYPSMKKLTTSSPSTHPGGFFGAIEAYRNMPSLLFCWSPEQYVGIYQRCSEIVDQVQPDIVAVDSLFNQAFDMCRQKLARGIGPPKYVVLNPMDFTNTIAVALPGLVAWWKIPV